MQKKNIFKTLALAMLMPTMLLTTACSSEDDVVNSNIANLETVAKKGYALPVTVNVTREGDKGSNRATYTDNGDGTGSLGFSAGDKLFVKGHASGTAGFFAGTLTMVSAGTFSGTIYTENLYDGDADALLAEAGMVRATLLPDGYETPGFLSISGSGATASISSDASKAFATSKAAAVEQFSYEMSTTYSSGFALSPANVILNFTITGLTASTEVTASFTDEYSKVISGNVTTDGSGNATFAIGVAGNTNLKNCTLTVGGNAITLTSSDKYLTEGKIYNITRSAASAATGHALSAAVVGDVVGSDGQAYDGTDYNNLPTGVTAVAKVCYVSGGHGLALALADESSTMNWSTAITTAAAHTPTVTGGTWKLATKDEWNNMFTGAGGAATLRTSFSGVNGTNMLNEIYWSSTEGGAADEACGYQFSNSTWNNSITRSYGGVNVRACLAF